MRQALEALVVAPDDRIADDDDAADRTGHPNASAFHALKHDPGGLSLQTVLDTAAKILRLRQLGLPSTLFQGVVTRLVHTYREQAAGEPPREVRRHPEALRLTLLACFCTERLHELTDQLVDMLLDIVKRIGARAERRVERAYIAEVKRVRGTSHLAYAMADAALANPTGTVSAVIYPAAGGEAKLRALVAAHRSTAAYEEQVQTTMRASYGRHYRRIPSNAHLSFQQHHAPAGDHCAPVADPLCGQRSAPVQCRRVPLAVVGPAAWHEFVVQTTTRGQPRINRISYELCVLNALRDKVRCKEIWVAGAKKHRNPDEDLPQDFDERRTDYYATLSWPQEAATAWRRFSATWPLA